MTLRDYSSGSAIAEALRPFPHRWRFSVDLQHAVRVLRWYLKSSALVQLEHQHQQWPTLCWEIGHHVFETQGPDDLQMMAIVELAGGTNAGQQMPLMFKREALP